MARGIPSARSVDHVGLTVPDLDAAVTFFVEVLGADLLLRGGPFEDPTGPWMAEHLAVHPRTRLDLALLRLGPTLNVELFAATAPGQRTEEPPITDVGAAHLAFFVDDLDAALAYLREQGLRVHGEPTTIEDGPSRGLRWVHAEAPWGLVLELVRWPPGMPYEAATAARLAGPAPAWD